MELGIVVLEFTTKTGRMAAFINDDAKIGQGDSLRAANQFTFRSDLEGRHAIDLGLRAQVATVPLASQWSTRLCRLLRRMAWRMPIIAQTANPERPTPQDGFYHYLIRISHANAITANVLLTIGVVKTSGQ